MFPQDDITTGCEVASMHNSGTCVKGFTYVHFFFTVGNETDGVTLSWAYWAVHTVECTIILSIKFVEVHTIECIIILSICGSSQC